MSQQEGRETITTTRFADLKIGDRFTRGQRTFLKVHVPHRFSAWRLAADLTTNELHGMAPDAVVELEGNHDRTDDLRRPDPDRDRPAA